ncbi:TPA: type III secretion inner membrane ring lipoprotein SctJ [Burkholderia stabilis]|nr:type III secretion inner membrane ring lipoprotein SctJ [Burkholderia stabilis]HDR9536495.1 type III secretion inner membrane ring lipoprotein SctJ [Burkholderia stabilis]HDR9552008.1 type III secretion inner membrane ring lipoprotein SctJ [Burkholderia stabilis]HDR9562970.1 type III secretion inner membrane ring lipoprotein SctJ [Burkholderia stabilis]HDR9571565.1 type III secretion inner membrane ring lipoprotein SctJ [Burkholderia stabilis]
MTFPAKRNIATGCACGSAHRTARPGRPVSRLMIVMLCAVILAGCKKEVYGNLTEPDANEMLVALLEQGVDASKDSSDGGKSWTLDVEDRQLVRAMQVLRAHGLPRSKFDDLGNLFKKDGLVSTPTEERVRFVYGVSQELSSTLSKIDGVMVARVQIVLPNNDPLAQDIKPSSAAVFIKYRPDTDINTLIPQIKTLVMHSVEGLTYDHVSVTTVAADPLELSRLPAPASSPWSMVMLFGGLVALLAGAGFAVYRFGLKRRVPPLPGWLDTFAARLRPARKES